MVALLLAPLLSGCGMTASDFAPSQPTPTSRATEKSNSGDQGGDIYKEVTYQLSDGRTVICLRVIGHEQSSSANGGLSCDWAHAK
jgi:hypothetical protein